MPFTLAPAFDSGEFSAEIKPRPPDNPDTKKQARRSIWIERRAMGECGGSAGSRWPSLVLHEDALQFLGVVGRGQRHGRQNASFLRIQVVCNDPVVLVVRLFGIAQHEAAGIDVR